MNKCLGSILLVLTIPLALMAQSSSTDASIGTWKLNVAKSKFNPGPAPKSRTVTIASDHKITVDEVGPDGKDIHYSFTPQEGTAVPVDGMDGMTVTEKRIDDHTVEHTWTMGNTITHGKGVIQADGNIMRYTMTGTMPDGTAVHDSEVYEKQ